jgi:hypothetical protein
MLSLFLALQSILYRGAPRGQRRTKDEHVNIVRVDKDVLSKDELAALQRKLTSMSVTGLHDFYFAAHYRCRLEQGKIPSARAVQELVQAWKAMRRP